MQSLQVLLKKVWCTGGFQSVAVAWLWSIWPQKGHIDSARDERAEVVKFTRSEVVAAWWSEENIWKRENSSGFKALLPILPPTVSNEQTISIKMQKLQMSQKSGSVQAKDAEVAQTQACGSERFLNLLSWSSLHVWLSSHPASKTLDDIWSLCG